MKCGGGHLGSAEMGEGICLQLHEAAVSTRCHFRVPHLPSAGKIQGFVLKIKEKVETTKSPESPAAPWLSPGAGGTVPTLGHSWGQVLTRSCFSLHKLPEYVKMAQETRHIENRCMLQQSFDHKSLSSSQGWCSGMERMRSVVPWQDQAGPEEWGFGAGVIYE